MGRTGITRQTFLRVGLTGFIVTVAGGAGRAAANKTVKLGMILPSSDQFRWKNADGRFFLEEAKKLGVDSEMQSSNMSEATQASQVENMLTLGIDALVLTPVNANAAASLVRKAKSAGVPVVNYNFLINKAECDAFVGRDAIEIGERIAQAAVDAKPKGNYVLCYGDEGMSVAVDTAKGNLNVLNPLVAKGDIKIISQQYNKSWASESARAQVENALTQANNDVVAVVCSNDGTAYGAIQALQAQGLSGKVFVTGVDAEPHAQELIRQGLLNISNFSAFDLMGSSAAQAALALARGEPVKADDKINNGLKDLPWIKAPNFNVSKDNLEENVRDRSWWFKPA